MSVSRYQIRTARTAKLPPFVPFGAYSEQTWKLDDIPPYLTGDVSNETWVVPRGLSEALPANMPLAVIIPDSYPHPANERPASQVTLFKVPHHGAVEFRNKTTSSSQAGSVSTVTLHSSMTDPGANTVQSFVSSIEDSTTAAASLVIVLGVAHALVAKQADEWLAKARAAARVGDLRAAYHGVYRGLDVLLKSAKWHRVSAELEEICSDQYPVTFGIGAMRFVSGAAERIPNWNTILERLRETARRQNADVRKAFRGLVEANAAK
jgi:hypothetical protein